MSTRRPFAGPRFWRHLAAIASLSATPLSVQGAPQLDFESTTFSAGTLFADPTASVQGTGSPFNDGNNSSSLYGDVPDLDRSINGTARGNEIHASPASQNSGDTDATPLHAMLESQIDALMLAGVGAMVFIARRRRAR